MSAERPFSASDEGSTAVEFALVAPVFFAMLFGLVQLCLAMYSADSVRHALTAQARALSLSASMTSNDLQTAVRNNLVGIDRSHVTVTMTRTTAAGVKAAVATATYTSTMVIPMLGSYPMHFSSTVTVTSP